MNIDLALCNFDILNELPENTRLYASRTEQLSYDNRWFQGARRTLDGSSREDIFVPINKTFIAVAVDNKKTLDEMIECISHLRSRFQELYPDFTKVFSFLDYLESFIRGFMSGYETHRQRQIMSSAELLEKVIEDIANEKREIVVIPEGPIEPVKELTPEQYMGLMYSESESDMDDTEELPPLETDCEIETDDGDSESDMDNTRSEEDEEHVPEVTIVNPLVDRPLQECMNRFEKEIKERVLPPLKRETDRMFKSLDNDIERGVNELRRRFVSPIQISNEDEIDRDIKITIPTFHEIRSVEFRQRDSQTEYLLSEDSSEEYIVGGHRNCIDNFMNDVQEEFDIAVEQIQSVCNSLGRVITRYI